MADVNAVKEITAKLETGVKELFESEKYAEYLKTMSRFHHYSTRNTILIHLQLPEATHVAGYRAWKQKFNRQVKKGEHGIKIFAPMPFVVKEELAILDPVTKQPVIGEDGQPLTEEYIKLQSARFKIVPVFDISQTIGDPLPVLAESLTGNVERYELFMDALRAVSPLPIMFEPMPSDVDGTCYFGDRIAIREGMSEIQTVSAVIHEITHAKLHDLQLVTDNGDKPKDRRTEEVEAESVAFSTLAYYGIDTGANSFGYLAEWSKGRELKELNASLDTIRKTTASLIDSIDEQYRTLAKERGIDLSADVPENVQETDTPAENENAPDYDIMDDREEMIRRIIDDTLKHDPEFPPKALEGMIEDYRSASMEGLREAYLFYFPNDPPALEQEPPVVDEPTPESAVKPDVSNLISDYARNATVSNHIVGENVLLTPVFIDGSYNRAGKKIRVTVEEPAGKYELFSRIESGDKKLYLLTASGRIEQTAWFFPSEWDDAAHKRVDHLPTEAELDAVIPEIAERFESDMTNPTKWAMYQQAAVLNRLGECDAHNAPVRELREAENKRRQAEGERQRQAEQQAQDEKYNGRIDEIATAIKDGKTISVGYNEYEYDGRNPVLDLFRLYGIKLPLRTQGWVNTGLAEINDGGYRYYKSKHKGDSSSFHGYLKKLREAINNTSIQELRNTVQPTNNTEVKKSVEHELFEKFAALFPDIANCKYSYMRLESKGFEPLSIERIGGGRISVMHTYELNGDLCYDPMMSFVVDSDKRTMTAAEYEQSIPPLYQRVDKDGSGQSIDGNGREQHLRNLRDALNGFAGKWLDNIAEQEYMPVRANLLLEDDEEIQITFDGEGNPIMPKLEPVPDNSTEHSLYERFSEIFPQFMNQEYSNMTLEAPYAKPLALEWVFGDMLSIAHTYEHDGNLNVEPLVMFKVNSEQKTMSAYSLEVTHPPRHDSVYPEPGNPDLKMQNNIVDFTNLWLDKIEKQGFKPITATLWNEGKISDVDIQVTFDKDGNRIMPEQSEKKYALDYGFLGVGITVWNRAEEVNGDCATVAHISTERIVTVYDKDMPETIKQKIEAVAQSPDTWAFGFKPLPGMPMPEIEKSNNTELDLTLPDPSIGQSEMNLYGYSYAEMLPLLQGRAVELFDTDHAIYLLYPDNTEAMALDRDEILNHDGLCGIESADWERSPILAAQLSVAKTDSKIADGSRESDLLYGEGNKFGIYQIPSGIEEARDFRFASMRELEAHGLTVDRANYELVYTGSYDLADRQMSLDRIYADFQHGSEWCPPDYNSRSVSVSDVIVLQIGGEISSYFVDSIGFVEIDSFLGNETPNKPERTAPTVAELESDAKAGKVVSLMDLSKAINAERKPPAQKPSLLARLEQGKQRAAQQGQTDASKSNNREV